MSRSILVIVGLLAAVANCIGCGGTSEPADRPGRVPVTVTVTYNGAAVSDADVIFVPKDGGKAAYGMTDASGVAKLTTFPDTPEDGAVAGEYLVAVEKTAGGGDDMGSGEEEDVPEVSEEGMSDDGGIGLESVLPGKYADETTSGLTATVSQGSGEFTFELTD